MKHLYITNGDPQTIKLQDLAGIIDEKFKNNPKQMKNGNYWNYDQTHIANTGKQKYSKHVEDFLIKQKQTNVVPTLSEPFM